MALIGNAIAGEADRVKFTRKDMLLNRAQFVSERTAVDTEELFAFGRLNSETALGIRNAKDTNQLNQLRIASQANNAQAAYAQNVGSLIKRFGELTLPSFDLAQRQYGRDLTALLSNTESTVEAANTPYREAIIIDPPEPIAGLKPQKGKFTPVAKPSYGSILGSAFVSGAQGALSMSYTDNSGNLAFR